MAPAVNFHQGRSAPPHWNGFTPETRWKMSEPPLRNSGGALGNSRGSRSFSASVTYPVASTNFLNWALVTSVTSIQKPLITTACAGASSACFSSALASPIVNSPPGIQAIPAWSEAGMRGGSRRARTTKGVTIRTAAARTIQPFALAAFCWLALGSMGLVGF